MEMEKITTEKERKKEDEGKSEPKAESKPEEEEEPDHYSRLQNLPEDVYSEACYTDPPFKTKPAKQTEANARLYRAGCILLTIMCLVLLLVVIVLSLKLQNGSHTDCPESEIPITPGHITPKSASPCNYEHCKDFFSSRSSIEAKHLGCRQCADGWLTFGRSCFFLSTYRLGWEQSQRNCTARGGSLAIITSREVQNFLSKEGNLKYWIGLRQKGNMWTWVNNTAIRESYWAGNAASGDCGILNSENQSDKNWIKAPCDAHTYFVCQLQF
ncbi:C-type lectin domain family 2 member D isoform X2 [Lates calcarifer]|uniref:C-type lectin domain family 2 member D isoform X2 n=1 Tax=Lates calcarifer TaxID=8187 RepID=A0AAJ7V6S8_LATCA|nr:C-type lectin domain family 2 member D isoform X2 [Lates calcarifer]